MEIFRQFLTGSYAQAGTGPLRGSRKEKDYHEKDEAWKYRYGYLKNGPWHMVDRRRPGMGRRP